MLVWRVDWKKFDRRRFWFFNIIDGERTLPLGLGQVAFAYLQLLKLRSLWHEGRQGHRSLIGHAHRRLCPPHESRAMTEPSIRNVTFGRAAPGLAVRDIQAAYAFYAGVLGFSRVFENGDPVGFMVLEKDGAEIHLSQSRDHHPRTVNAFHMIVDDIDGLYAICQAAKVRIIKSLQGKDYGQRAFVFADPDGNRIDVGQPVSEGPRSKQGGSKP